MVWWDSYINTHERIGCNFQGQNIRNVLRACKARHHYDVTNKCCIVTTTTSLVERTPTFSAINVVICCFEELLAFWQNTNFTNIKCGINSGSGFSSPPGTEPRGELIAQYRPQNYLSIKICKIEITSSLSSLSIVYACEFYAYDTLYFLQMVLASILTVYKQNKPEPCEVDVRSIAHGLII